MVKVVKLGVFMKNSLYNSSIYMEQLDSAINNYELFSTIKDVNIFITGATGLIGSAIVDLLMRNNEINNAGNFVYIACRDKEKARDRFEKYSNSQYLKVVYYDACKNNELDGNYDYIIHAASNAFPALISKEPVETILSNVQATNELLELAVKCRATNTVYISSSEVYGKKENSRAFVEDEYGYVDILNSRSSYPLSKRMGENLCISYAVEHGINVNIVRPGHIYGPTASKRDNRVSSQFAFLAAEGKDIVMKSEGMQLRSYCYMIDCATAILYVMLNGENMQAYNISNSQSIITIRQLAQQYAEYANVKVVFDVPSEQEKAAFNPMDNSSLNSEKIEKLGWHGMYNAEKGTISTIQILKQMQAD